MMKKRRISTAWNVQCATLPSYPSAKTSQVRAKGRDHGIVRAQEKVSKGHPNTPPKS